MFIATITSASKTYTRAMTGSRYSATRALSRDVDTSHIPVLIVSTKGLETDRVWGMRQGAKDYIVKPPREGDLIARINALIGH